MSLTATARSIDGTLQQEVTIGDGYRMLTDQPVAAGGDGAGPSPHALLSAALAACVAWSIVRYARTKGWGHLDVDVDVTYDHHATPRLVTIGITVGGDLDPEQLGRLRKVAAACPVRRSLETGFEFIEHIHSGATT